MRKIEHNGIAITADTLPKKKKVSLLVGTQSSAVQVGTFDSPEKAEYFMIKLCDMIGLDVPDWFCGDTEVNPDE